MTTNPFLDPPVDQYGWPQEPYWGENQERTSKKKRPNLRLAITALAARLIASR